MNKIKIVVFVIAAIFAASSSSYAEEGVVMPVDNGEQYQPTGQSANQLIQNQGVVENAVGITAAGDIELCSYNPADPTMIGPGCLENIPLYVPVPPEGELPGPLTDPYIIIPPDEFDHSLQDFLRIIA